MHLRAKCLEKTLPPDHLDSAGCSGRFGEASGGTVDSERDERVTV